jgi:hypothetical protein
LGRPGAFSQACIARTRTNLDASRIFMTGISDYYLAAAHETYQPLFRTPMPRDVAETVFAQHVRPKGAAFFRNTPPTPTPATTADPHEPPRPRLGIFGTPSQGQLRCWLGQAAGAEVARKACNFVGLDDLRALRGPRKGAGAKEPPAVSAARRKANKEKAVKRRCVLLKLVTLFTYGAWPCLCCARRARRVRPCFACACLAGRVVCTLYGRCWGSDVAGNVFKCGCGAAHVDGD